MIAMQEPYPWRLRICEAPAFAGPGLKRRIGREMPLLDGHRLERGCRLVFGFASRSQREQALGAIRASYGWTTVEPVHSTAGDRRPWRHDHSRVNVAPRPQN
jgi:hypothetical protein